MVFALTAIIITTLTQIGLTIFLIIKTNTMAKKQSEVAAELASLTGLVKKIQGEITEKLAALAEAIASQGNASPEVETALAELTEAVKVADDLNPDPVVVPDPETPTEEPTDPTA